MPRPLPCRRAVRLLSSCAIALLPAWLWSVPVAAQQALDLRGSVLESRVSGELLGTPRTSASAAEGISSSGYAPFSAGALPDDGGAGQRASGEGFADDVFPQPAPRRAAPRPRALATPSAARVVDDDNPATGTVRSQRIGGFEEDGSGRASAENLRAGAIELSGRRAEENPYSPVGLRLGSFILNSTLDQGIGWTSNGGSSAVGSPSAYSETGLRLNAVSDWSRHSATLQADGRYRKSFSGSPIDEMEGGAAATFRQEIGNEFSALYALGYRLRPESATSPVVIVGTASRPLRHTLTGSAGINKDVGALRFGLRGEVTRDMYGDAQLSGGGTLSQKERDATLATVALRAGYRISPAVIPFIEAEYGRRFHDQKLDSAGYERSANRLALRAGVELDISEKLRGEFSGGWLTERPDDTRLAAIAAPSLSASLAWSPVRGTTVDLSGSTTVEGSTSIGESGSILYSGDVAVTHELLRNLTGTARFGADLRDYVGGGGREQGMRAEAELTWWLNRYAGITGRARHELLRSTLPGRSYSANSVYLGVRLQR